MSATLIQKPSRYHLSVLLDDKLASAAELLRNLESSGVLVHEWRLGSTESIGTTRLIAEVTGNPSVLQKITAQHECRLQATSEAFCLELALITVDANGETQDKAASLLAEAGGRLVSLSEDRFTAQLTARPEMLESVLHRLGLIAKFESIRSGGLALERP